MTENSIRWKFHYAIQIPTRGIGLFFNINLIFFKDPPGKINTFVRGCEEKPTLLNEVIDDPTFKTFYRSCTSDLCNDGDGTKSSNQVNISPDGYSGENMLVPGLPFKNSAAVKTSWSFLVIVSLMFLV